MEESLNPNLTETPPVVSVQEKRGFLDILFSQRRLISFIVGIIFLSGVGFGLFKLFFSSSQKQKVENVTLVYWGLWEDKTVFSALISEFERNYPNIKIDYQKQDIKSLGNYIERLRTRQSNNTGPDLFRFHNSWTGQIKDLLLPFPQDVVSQTEIDSKYYPVIQSDLKQNGAYYGIAMGIDNLMMFINQDLFKNAGITTYPQNWDDLVDVARKLTVQDQDGNIKTAGAALGTFDNISHAPDLVSLLFLQNGANPKDLLGINRKNAEDALSFYASFAQGDAKVWDSNMDNSKLAFAKERVAIYFGYSWDIFEIKAANPNLQFKVVSVPNIINRKKTVASYWVEGVSAKSKHPKEAFEFIKFISKQDTLEKLYKDAARVRLFGQPYPRMDMANLLKDNPYVSPIIEQAGYAASSFFVSDTFDGGLNTSANAYLADAINGIVFDRISPQTALTTLAKGVDEVISRYEKQD